MIARELTKLHEEIIHLTAAEAKDLRITERGEFTVVLGPHVTPSQARIEVSDDTLADYFYHMTKNNELSRRQAAASTARKFGLSPNEVYARLERLKASDPS